MSSGAVSLVLPRPGAETTLPPKTIAGPPEESFTSTFGALLPPARYLSTDNGKAAYYSMPPSPPPTPDTQSPDTKSPERVLFIHGVQTPALGMLPLARQLHSSFPTAHFVLLDLWGHGLSDTPVAPHTASLFHGLIDALLDHLQWPSAHMVGFSFGASLTAGYVALRTTRVQSYTLVAPAGLIKSASFSAAEQAHLQPGSDEAAAQKWVLEFLEGGDLLVPADWEERVARGEVVAEAVRKWQMDKHPAHTASVVGIFRDGGVLDNQQRFEAAIATGVPAMVVQGEKDDLCTPGELVQLGFQHVFVVPDVGHAVVRERVPEVAEYGGDCQKFLLTGVH